MQFLTGPASAGPVRVCRLIAALLASFALVMGGCANPFADDLPEVSQEPLPGLGEKPSGAPEPVAEGEDVGGDGAGATTTVAGGGSATATTARATATTSGSAGSTPGGGGGTASGGGSGGGSAAATARTLARVEDRKGDAGIGAPAYGDCILLVVESVGDRARVTVRVSAAMPSTLAEQEVVGVGVDFYRSGGSESEYQLFADGGSDGWRAFLHTPEGFVAYPGEFHLGGDTLQFEVPWSALGGNPAGKVSAFVDWGKPTVAGIVTRTQDLAPDRGSADLQS